MWSPGVVYGPPAKLPRTIDGVQAVDTKDREDPDVASATRHADRERHLNHAQLGRARILKARPDRRRIVVEYSVNGGPPTRREFEQ